MSSSRTVPCLACRTHAVCAVQSHVMVEGSRQAGRRLCIAQPIHPPFLMK